MRQRIPCGLVAALFARTRVSAQSAPEQLKPCALMRHDAEVACYDKAVASIEAGLSSIRRRRRRICLVPMPRFRVFGAKSDAKREELQQISAQVTSCAADDGMITFTLDNGQVWRQQDNKVSLSVDAGDAVNIAAPVLVHSKSQTRGSFRTRQTCAKILVLCHSKIILFADSGVAVVSIMAAPGSLPPGSRSSPSEHCCNTADSPADEAKTEAARICAEKKFQAAKATRRSRDGTTSLQAKK